MDTTPLTDEVEELERGPHFVEESGQAGRQPFEAWEQVDVGRYMPRRIRGSNRGRALG